MGDGDNDNAVSNAAKVAVLLHDKSEVEDDPTKHTRSKLAPSLDVYLAKDGQVDTGVQLTSDEPVVEHVTGTATSSKFAHVGILGMLDTKRSDVAVSGQKVGDEDVACQDADVVVSDEGPDGELRTVGDGASGKESHDEDSRVPGCILLALRKEDSYGMNIPLNLYMSLPPLLSSVPSTSWPGRNR